MVVSDSAAGATPPPSGMPPTSNLAPRDLEELASELVAYHALFGSLFRREEQRHWALKYSQAQMLDLERKSIEPMALALEGGNVQAMQQFIGVGAWDDEAVLRTHQGLVAETLGDRDSGVLIIDGCEFPKQGKDSAGVAHQYCGPLGKLANCQASVLACYASRHGYSLVDRHLYLPEKWFGQEYRERRQKCGVPSDLTFQTHQQLAWQMIRTLHGRDELPFEWVTFDEGYGDNPELLDRIAGLGLNYLAEVPISTRVWQQRPKTEVPAAKETGRPPTRERICADEPEPIRVDRLAEQFSSEEWRQEVIKAGAKGPIVAEFAFRRVVAVRQGLPGPEVWVVFRRSLGAKRELKVYLSNAAPSTPKATFVRVSGMRWPIESAIEECKGELGMDHYEVRGWVGWHHHLTMTFLAHHFLVRLRLRLGPKGGGANRAPGPSVAHCCPAQAAARHPDRHRAHPVHSTKQPRGLSLPPPTHLAAPRLVLGN